MRYFYQIFQFLIYLIASMEKGESYLEQILHLKKSIQNKRKREVWEKVLDFYRNHQVTLSNFEILKLIKLASKPLLSTIKSLFKNISLHPDSKHQTLNPVMQNLVEAKRALSILFDCYTQVIESYLQFADPPYFNTIFHLNYRPKRDRKELIFEPTTINHAHELDAKLVEHELKDYLNFICAFAIVELTEKLCLDHADIVGGLRKVQSLFDKFSAHSPSLAKKKLEFEILKLNISWKLEIKVENLKFECPLEIIYQMYKNSKNWKEEKKTAYFSLLMKYIYLLIKVPGVTPNSQPLEAQIYSLWKEIELLKSYIFIPFNIFHRKIFESMSSFSDSYERAQRENQQINYIIGSYLKETEISELAQEREKNKEVNDNSRNAQKNNNCENQTGKSTALKVTFGVVEQKKRQMKEDAQDFPIMFKQLIERTKDDIFNLIEESDSDSEGELVYKFEKERKSKFESQSKKPMSLLQIRNKLQDSAEKQSPKIKQKFKELFEKTQRFQNFSQTAIEELHKRRTSLKDMDQVDGSESLKKPSPIKFRQEKAKTEPKKWKKSQEKHRFLQGGEVCWEEEKPKVKFKSITLQEKYDKMSQKILLSNTNKENPFDM